MISSLLHVLEEGAICTATKQSHKTCTSFLCCASALSYRNSDSCAGLDYPYLRGSVGTWGIEIGAYFQREPSNKKFLGQIQFPTIKVIIAEVEK